MHGETVKFNRVYKYTCYQNIVNFVKFYSVTVHNGTKLVRVAVMLSCVVLPVSVFALGSFHIHSVHIHSLHSPDAKVPHVLEYIR